VYPAACCGCLE